MKLKLNQATLFTLFITLCAAACAPDQTDLPQSVSARGTSAGEELGKADISGEIVDSLSEQPEGCVFDESDSYEPRTTFVKGPWLGECHDTRQRRPVDFVSDEEASEYQDPAGYLVINNVYHQGAFWYAFVPQSAILNVYFQLEYFPAVIPAGHTQLRVEYKTPVVLYGQSSINKGQRDEVLDLTLSIEAVTRPGDKYDLFKGAQEHFAIAYRVTTMEARYEDMVLRQGHHVEQWRLLLEEEEAEALLAHYVSVSSEHGLDFAYHTLFKNCTTEIIETLDGIAIYSWREQIQRFLVKVTEIYPNIVRAALIARGLLPLDQSTDWAPLEEDEAFQERYQKSAF